jgi:hypothetical protein
VGFDAFQWSIAAEPVNLDEAPSSGIY